MKISRIMTLKFDKLVLERFECPEDFGRAMKLLAKSSALKSDDCSFDEYEQELLSDLDQYDEYLLTKAERLNSHINSQYVQLEGRIKALQLAVDKLSVDGRQVTPEFANVI